VSKILSFTASCLGAIAAGAIVTTARASDLTLTSTVSDSTEYNDNFLLKTGPASGVLGSYSTISLFGTQRTATSTLDFSGNLSYRKYFGPGAHDLPLSENISDGLNFRYQKFGRLQGDKDFIGASYRQADAALVQRQDIGVATVTGNINTYSVDGGGSRQLSALDSLNWSANATTTTYSPSSGGTAFSNYLAGGSWAHRLNDTTDFVVSSDMTWLNYDDASQSRTTIFRAEGGIRSKLSSRLTLTANAGATLVNTTQEHPGGIVTPIIDPLTGIPFTIPPSAGSALGPVWDISLIYLWTKSTDFTVTASESVTPGATGSVSTREIATAAITHRINSASTLNLSASATHFAAGGPVPVSDVFVTGASYDYRFTRDLRANLNYSYRFRRVEDTPTAPGNSAHSNSIILTISQDTTLKP
jgi:hypothetical protein